MFVRDKALNGGNEFMYYMSMFQFKTYEDYLNQAGMLKGPTLIKPEGLPEGYKFVKGNIQPPTVANKDKYEKEVKAEAKGKAAHFKKIEWKEIGEINLEFANGKDNLRMQVSYKINKDKPNSEYRYYTPEDYDAETVKKFPDLARNTLVWSDEDHVYNITTNPGNPLTKEEMIKLAEEAVKK
ncbi:DUF4367 domain-containing protein [Paenibacillus sp. DMB20]|uniref:DUF4367 domain-containing protein n=1 Tax=Paenibacillus sp. DMB20 TaxID=1642570 RepID=UPI00069AE8D0|nr:DUF4367 domain-containing protein [Paenibacillus sp. DMB20]